ncbi:MAG: hypothetical protein R6X02_05895 [Enhygromyxa sp.]
MPSETHQNFVQLFRDHPAVVFELARRAGAAVDEPDAPYERLEATSTEVDDPVEAGNAVRADVAVASYVGETAQRALALEVQLGRDKNKQWSMVLYRAGLRYHLSCPAWTLYFSPDPQVRESVEIADCSDLDELRDAIVRAATVATIDELLPH